MKPEAECRPILKALWALGFGLVAVHAEAAGAQEACSTHAVQDKDTLGAISMAACGDLRFQLLFNANVDVLRSDPSAPPPGTVLPIPCEDGRMTAQSAAPMIQARAPEDLAEAAPASDEGTSTAYRPEIRIVSGGDWVPFAELAGARLCPVEGNLFHDLETQGLVEPTITIRMEDEEELCLQGLLDGKYDVASFKVQFAPVAFATLGIPNEIVQNPNLSTIQSSVVIAYKDNPRSADAIAFLNRGLAIMRQSKEWSEVVSGTLAEAETLEATP